MGARKCSRLTAASQQSSAPPGWDISPRISTSNDQTRLLAHIYGFVHALVRHVGATGVAGLAAVPTQDASTLFCKLSCKSACHHVSRRASSSRRDFARRGLDTSSLILLTWAGKFAGEPQKFGFRFGDRGTHSSRAFMFTAGGAGGGSGLRGPVSWTGRMRQRSSRATASRNPGPGAAQTRDSAGPHSRHAPKTMANA